MSSAVHRSTGFNVTSLIGVSGYLARSGFGDLGMTYADGYCAHQLKIGAISRASRMACLPGHYETDVVSCSTRERIRSFQIPLTVDDLPRFLWEGERVDPRDMNKGFLRGELLIKVRILPHSGLNHLWTCTEHT